MALRAWAGLLVIAQAIPRAAGEEKAAKPQPAYWGELDPAVKDRWVRKHVLRKGYLPLLLQQGAKGYPEFAERAEEARVALNAQRGNCAGRWLNIRVALAHLVDGVARLAFGGEKRRKGLEKPLRETLAAVGEACVELADGGEPRLVRALTAARDALRKKAGPILLRKIRLAFEWLQKPSAWAPRPATPAAGPEPSAVDGGVAPEPSLADGGTSPAEP